MTITVTGRSTTTLVDGRGFALRHVRPGAGEGASTVTLLGRSYGFEWLPTSTLPTSPDLVEGSYTRRINDAGEFSLRFPNVASSKGLWREKFSEAGALEFVEIHRDGVLEFVGSVERVEIDRGTVTISGPDAWGLLKRAYERDRTWWDAPSTVIDAYTRVPVPVLREQWASLSGWTTQGTSPGPQVSNGLLRLTKAAGSNPFVERSLDFGSSDWMIETSIQRSLADPHKNYLILYVGATQYVEVRLVSQGSLTGYGASGVTITLTHGETFRGIPDYGFLPMPVALGIIKQGSLLVVTVNGAAVSVLESGTFPSTMTLQIGGEADLTGSEEIDTYWGPLSVVRSEALMRRGTERGDVVLPGDLPGGGLRGRYHNIGDLAGYTTFPQNRRARTLTPNRQPYGERLDGPIDFAGSPLPLQPGAASDWFAVRWTGGVYLPLSGGQVEFRLANVDDGARLWVGRTGTGEELLNRWNETAGTIGPATTALGSADGWYPLRLEYFETTGSAIVSLQFRRVAAGWTDPGGTVIAANTWTVVPATSLSPLGCHEARIQGQSHFEIVKDAAAQAGYELLCEPMTLESGEFPGRLVPRLRVGRDTDLLLEVEDRDDAEPILSPAVTRDSSDQAVRFIGSGAGNADGQGSQVLAEVVDLDADTLFELQAFADAGDASITQLLEARLNAELALRATPWEEVRGTPRGMERLADTWPLTGTLSAMRWRPGDGIRISVPDIGVRDIEPRRITQVTRSFAAEGRTQTTVGFRQRPRGAAVALRRLARSVALGGRSYQPRPETLESNFVSTTTAASAFTGFAVLPLLAGDQVVRAECRIVGDSGTGALTLEINGTDRTTALGGGWSTRPVNIDITAYATQASATDNRLYARVGRPGGGASGDIQFQVVVVVTRR